MFGLYIHVPFCKKVCDYCDFRVLPSSEKLFQEYSDLICLEVESFQRAHPGHLQQTETLYLGGGTPSILPPKYLSQVLQCLFSAGVKFENLKEFSMEFNPESTSAETVENALNSGVRRISLGLQTFDPQLLLQIGRSHSVEAGEQALRLLLEYPQVQVSADLMFSLPGQTLESFLGDVDRLSDFPLNHISFYGLTVNPRTLLGQKFQKGVIHLDEELYEPMYQGGVEILQKKGFERYEVSNFAKPGFESLHNQNYWKRGEYVGFGPGAHSFLDSKRFFAPEVYPRWRDYVKSGCPHGLLTVDELSQDDILMEVFWLSLRQAKGLNLLSLRQIGYSLPENACSKWVRQNFLEYENGFIRLVGRGWIFMDQIVTDLTNRCSKLE